MNEIGTFPHLFVLTTLPLTHPFVGVVVSNFITSPDSKET